MTIKSKIFILVATIGIFGAIGGIYAYRYFSANKTFRTDEGEKTIAQELRDCLPKSDVASKEKCDQLVATIKTFEQCTDAGFSITRKYPEQCRTPDGRIFVNDNPPDESDLSKAKEAVRVFMGNPNLDLKYIGQSRHPSNFGVLSNVKQTSGGLTADNPKEWDRPIYIFQQTDYINDRCEVYEYEVSVKTSQVIQVSVSYPKDNISRCVSELGSLEIPLKTKAEIEQAAFAYLGRDTEHTKFLLRSDIQPEYTSSKPGAVNPAHNIWQWEDKNYRLPEGLVGDPSPYPTMRIIMSSGGKLVNYLNTTDLFDTNYER